MSPLVETFHVRHGVGDFFCFVDDGAGLWLLEAHNSYVCTPPQCLDLNGVDGLVDDMVRRWIDDPTLTAADLAHLSSDCVPMIDALEAAGYSVDHPPRGDAPDGGCWMEAIAEEIISQLRDDVGHCTRCSGSGEGAHESRACRTCGGSGVAA